MLRTPGRYLIRSSKSNALLYWLSFVSNIPILGLPRFRSSISSRISYCGSFNLAPVILPNAFRNMISRADDAILLAIIWVLSKKKWIAGEYHSLIGPLISVSYVRFLTEMKNTFILNRVASNSRSDAIPLYPFISIWIRTFFISCPLFCAITG